MGPGMGSKAPVTDFRSDPRATVFSISGCLNVFFLKQLQGAHLSIARDLRAVIGDRLCTTFHMPYAQASYLGIPADSCGVPPNPLETGRILTRGTLSVAQ